MSREFLLEPSALFFMLGETCFLPLLVCYKVYREDRNKENTLHTDVFPVICKGVAFSGPACYHIDDFDIPVSWEKLCNS